MTDADAFKAKAFDERITRDDFNPKRDDKMTTRYDFGTKSVAERPFPAATVATSVKKWTTLGDLRTGHWKANHQSTKPQCQAEVRPGMATLPVGTRISRMNANSNLASSGPPGSPSLIRDNSCNSCLISAFRMSAFQLFFSAGRRSIGKHPNGRRGHEIRTSGRQNGTGFPCNGLGLRPRQRL